jgi:hypothetical protein
MNIVQTREVVDQSEIVNQRGEVISQALMTLPTRFELHPQQAAGEPRIPNPYCISNLISIRPRNCVNVDLASQRTPENDQTATIMGAHTAKSFAGRR